MKIHFLTIGIYIFSVLILVAGIIFFEQPVLLMLLAPLLLLPALEIPLFLKQYKRLSFKITSSVSSVVKGNSVPITFIIDNPGFFPFLNCQAECYVNNLFYPENKQSIISFPAEIRQETENTVNLQNIGCGMTSFRCDNIMLTDNLHFITITIPFSKRIDIPVLPMEREIGNLPQNTPNDGLEEYEESSLKGNVSSDIKEIREYHSGDRIQRIHWKLSAKLDELFVKEMAHTSILSMIILPKFTQNNIEDTLSTLFSLSKQLIQAEERFEICLYNHSACDFQYFTISDEEELTQAFFQSYYLPLYETEEAMTFYQASAQKEGTIIQVKGNDIFFNIEQ